MSKWGTIRVQIVYSAAAYLIKRFGDLKNIDNTDSFGVTKKVNSKMLEKLTRRDKFWEYLNNV